jgi:hypothetical protein
MNNQFCMCGVQPGYQHKVDCPFPAYNARPEQQNRWNIERDKLVEECQNCGNLFFFGDGHWIGDKHGKRQFVCRDCE